MKSIVFTNLKGGCGKSMLIFQLAGMLSDRGLKVLVIDSDPQNNLSRAFTGRTHKYGLYEVLNNEISVNKAIIQPYKKTQYDSLKNIYLLPCNYDLFLYEKDSNNPQQIFELKEKLNTLKNFDYVLVDTNPSLSFVLTSVYAYVDYYIGVFDISNDALDGFVFLENTIIKNIKEKVNPKLTFKGIIINNRKISNFNTQCINAIRSRYKDSVFSTVISDSVVNKESRALNLPVIVYDAKHPATMQYAQIASEFLKRMESDN